ncbi:3-keto-disaccharide hydrolase [Pontibacter liquoris]|uniref:3-keto-disaccharide hydrolase n=1 Tax=Pontibacter liquoris TaxID=2905677 RepID=UPI001FA6B78A|nr:DUF1080 domain-containing protein [Pontibacter liquoris]
MLRKILTLLPLTALLACQTQQNETDMTTAADTETAAPDATQTAEDWIPLFDGKTTNGWHSYGQSTAGNAWKVEDGTLHLDAASKKAATPAQGGDLVTDQEFKDFDLQLEWKIAKNGNSGIIFYVQEDTAKYDYVWNTGPEMQVLDNNGHPDAKIHKHRAGDLYDLIASSEEPVKPAGEWNKAEIISKDGKLELFLNDKKVVTTTMWDDNWKKLIAGSKFADMPDFGTFKSGKIALQDHGDDVWFRNIRIKKL